MPNFIFAGVSHFDRIRPAVARYVRDNPGKNLNEIVGVISADMQVWKKARGIISNFSQIGQIASKKA